MVDSISRQQSNPLEALYEQHIARLHTAYAQVLGATEYDAVVIHSGLSARQSIFDDQYWPFKPTPTFAHWLPLCQPGVALLIAPGQPARLFRQPIVDFWEGEVEPESHHFWRFFDEVTIEAPTDIEQHLPTGRIAFIGNQPSAAEALKLGDQVNPAALVSALDTVRVHKSAYELECMAEASRRAIAGHLALKEAFFSSNLSELQLHLLYLKATSQDGVTTPYQNIVARDEHAAILHHVNYHRAAPVSPTQSLLVDAGATCLGYNSDITRTVAKGPGSEAFAALIRHMDTLQLELVARVTAGLPYESLHDQAHELLADVLRDVGIASASAEELVSSGATRKFFPQGLGHSLGLQVHDVGCRLTEPKSDNPFLRNTADIAVGQVFTVEPGCYFIAPLLQELRALPVAANINWKLVDALAYFGGVRIEDNIAVTDEGTVNMTRDNWPSKP